MLAKVPEYIIVEFLSIVRDEDPRDSEAANDAFTYEVLDILLHDSGQWFCLDPFGEVIDSYNEDFKLPYHDGEGSYYV